MNRRLLWVALLLLTLGLVACGGQSASEGASPPRGTPASGATDTTSDSDECQVSGPLRLFNWGEYMPSEVLEEFGRTYGVEVTEDNYSSNEELITKLRARNSGYDLVFPSDYAVAILADEGLLAPLNREAIPNASQVEPSLMGLYYDPENRYSMPYQWGTTGIAYNENYFDSPPSSYALIFDPAVAETQEGFFTILDDEREAIGAALRYRGHPTNDTDPAHIAEARDLLLAQKKFRNFSGYNSDNFYDTLASEEITFALAWSGGVALAASQNPAVKFVIPDEGGVIWQENVTIPADAPNKCTAELFINYILQPEVQAQITEFTYYNTPVPAAMPLLSEETRALVEAFTPDEATRGRLDWIERAQDTTIFSDAWTEIKSR